MDKTKVKSALKDLERILPDKHRRDTLFHFFEQLDLDKPALIALKGHLVVEEKLTGIIEKFVFHPEHLDKARLTFAQKVAIARSMSLREDKNHVWDLVGRLNTLRNTLSHSLEGGSRGGATAALRELYAECRGGKLDDWENRDEAVIFGAVVCCLGFLDSFEQEVERFCRDVDVMHTAVNTPREPRSAEGTGK